MRAITCVCGKNITFRTKIQLDITQVDRSVSHEDLCEKCGRYILQNIKKLKDKRKKNHE